MRDLPAAFPTLTRLILLIDDGLDAIAIGIDHECRIVVRAVMLAKAGRAVVAPAVPQRRAVERDDRLARRRREREVEAGPGSGRPALLKFDRELVAAARLAVSDFGLVLPDAHIAESGQRRIVERRRALQVGDSKRDVVEHAGYSRRAVRCKRPSLRMPKASYRPPAASFSCPTSTWMASTPRLRHSAKSASSSALATPWRLAPGRTKRSSMNASGPPNSILCFVVM